MKKDIGIGIAVETSGVTRPEPPRIRTSAIHAYGSPRHGFAFAYRCTIRGPGNVR
ncbi:MAG: hypothetical protein JW913_07885 [Chitinispirillaceae bacterium]|nr:hypothetical protein [Chitinispirillaceae bacterium]